MAKYSSPRRGGSLHSPIRFALPQRATATPFLSSVPVMKTTSVLTLAVSTLALADFPLATTARLTPFDPAYNLMVVYQRMNLMAVDEVVRLNGDDTALKQDYQSLVLTTETRLATGATDFNEYTASMDAFYAAHFVKYSNLSDLASEAMDHYIKPHLYTPLAWVDVIMDAVDQMVEQPVKDFDLPLYEWVATQRQAIEDQVLEHTNVLLLDISLDNFLTTFFNGSDEMEAKYFEVMGDLMDEMENRYNFTSWAEFVDN